jgi:hypothetical protein
VRLITSQVADAIVDARELIVKEEAIERAEKQEAEDEKPARAQRPKRKIRARLPEQDEGEEE